MKEHVKLLSLIIPTYNEEENIAFLLGEVSRYLDDKKIPFELIVVDDDSKDQTAALVSVCQKNNARIHLFVRKNEKGIGSALMYGFQHAAGDILIPLMADRCDALDDIDLLYVTMAKETYDVVFTNRFKKKQHTRDYPFFKKCCNRALNLLVAFLYRYPYTDLTNAFKAYRKDFVNPIHPTTDGFEMLLELPLICLLKKGSFYEIPVSWHERKKGASKLHLLTTGYKYLLVLLKYLPQRYRKHPKY